MPPSSGKPATSAVGAARLASTHPISAFLTQAEPSHGQIRHTTSAATNTSGRHHQAGERAVAPDLAAVGDRALGDRVVRGDERAAASSRSVGPRRDARSSARSGRITARRPVGPGSRAPWPRPSLAGAWLAVPRRLAGPALVGALLAAGAAWRSQPALLVIGCFGLATGLAGHAWQGAAPRRPPPSRAVVTLRTDPAPLGPGVVAEAVTGGRHLELRAFGGPARRLRGRLAGEELADRGPAPPASSRAVRPAPGSPRGGRGRRHPRQRGGRRAARWPGRPTGSAGLLVRGSRTMDPLDRSLYLGFVVGDDRAPAEGGRRRLPRRRPVAPHRRVRAERRVPLGGGRARRCAACAAAAGGRPRSPSSVGSPCSPASSRR